MKIEHLAIWVEDLEGMKNFYVNYLEMQCGEKYIKISECTKAICFLFPLIPGRRRKN
jgi:catechol 2,3-dioxygenase-like lactoylglutathione lyase family enzyme